MTHPAFTHSPLPPSVQNDMMDAGVWSAHCPIPLNRLNLVQFSYHDFSGIIHYDGSVVVLDVLAPHVENIFRHLFLQRFPLQSAKRIEVFEGSDDSSMAANNSSAFNYRPISGTNTLSIHSYGAAIDVNPVQNPCLCHPKVIPDMNYSVVEVWPSDGTEFLNRTNQRPGMVEPIVALFTDNGFRDWGGSWDHIVDYHHFQIHRPLAELLADMPKRHGDALFKAYVMDETRIPIEETLASDYKKDPEAFMTQYDLLT